MSQITDKICDKKSKTKKKKKELSNSHPVGDNELYDWDMFNDPPYSEHLCE